MFGFLLKVVLIALIVVAGLWYVGMKKGSLSLGSFQLDPKKILSMLPIDTDLLLGAKNIQPDQFKGQISGALDSLVTHPGRNPGPIVLGVKVSNDTIGTVTDVLMGLPSEQLNQVKSVICTP
ncbi:MAG: hypothetical protein Q7S31_03805 [bacterium]|nr:hypothetical protein [bacterium]